ncbi:MAG: class I adenylate-forming enzyme family protein [Pseudomonadota bacterium]
MTLDLINGNLGYLSHRIAQAHPQSTAVIDYYGSERRTWTYGALETEFNKAANALLSLGCKRGDKIAIGIGNRTEFITAMFGAMRAGLTPVPMNIKLGVEQLRYILEDAGCVSAVFDPASGPGLLSAMRSSALRSVLSLATDAGFDSYFEAVARAPSALEPIALEPNNIAIMPYTSGSTGRPKGVPLTHRSAQWYLDVMPGLLGEEFINDASVLVAVHLFHKNAMMGGVKLMFLLGGRLVILPSFEPRQFLSVLAQEKCNTTTGVPAMYALLLQQRDLLADVDLTHFKKAFVGSAPTTPSLLHDIEEALSCQVHQGYGLTEGGPVVFTQPDDTSPWGVERAPIESCGVPLPGGEVRLDGGENEGELWVKNPGMIDGYHNLPEVNTERFVNGWLRTGDIFYRDENGFYYFRGRTDDMFHCGGENVYPLEVETILRTHPAVADVAVAPIDHIVKGQVPAAAVVLIKNADATAADIRAHYLNHGPAYAHPRHIRFIEAMPLTSVGKVDRNRVKQLLQTT